MTSEGTAGAGLRLTGPGGAGAGGAGAGGGIGLDIGSGIGSGTGSGGGAPRRPRRREGGLRVQVRVVLALMHRDVLSRFGRSLLGYPWAVISPLTTLAVLSTVFTLLQRRAPVGESFLLFFATGYVPYMVFRLTSLRGFGTFANLSLFAFPTIKPIDALLSRLLLEFWTMVVAGLCVFLVIWLMGQGGAPTRVLAVAQTLVLVGGLSLGAGILNGCIEPFFNSWSRLYRVVVAGLFFASGVLYVPDWLPQQIRDVIVWNPLLHAVELFRSGFYPGYGARTLDVGYLATWAGVAVPLSLAVERVTRWTRLG